MALTAHNNRFHCNATLIQWVSKIENGKHDKSGKSLSIPEDSMQRMRCSTPKEIRGQQIIELFGKLLQSKGILEKLLLHYRYTVERLCLLASY